MAMTLSGLVAQYATPQCSWAACWRARRAVGIGGAGYLFGQALTLLLNDLKKLEEILLIAILLGGAAVWGWRRWKFRKKFR